MWKFEILNKIGMGIPILKMFKYENVPTLKVDREKMNNFECDIISESENLLVKEFEKKLNVDPENDSLQEKKKESDVSD